MFFNTTEYARKLSKTEIKKDWVKVWTYNPKQIQDWTDTNVSYTGTKIELWNDWQRSQEYAPPRLIGKHQRYVLVLGKQSSVTIPPKRKRKPGLLKDYVLAHSNISNQKIFLTTLTETKCSKQNIYRKASRKSPIQKWTHNQPKTTNILETANT